MATVTFLRPVHMGSYPTAAPGGQAGATFSATQVAAYTDYGYSTGTFFGEFSDVGAGIMTRAIIGSARLLDLDITGLQFTTTQSISGLVWNGVGNFISAALAGNDVFIGTAGADGYRGYGGNDTVSYANASAAIFAGLDEGGSGGDATGDTFNSIENLTGSRFDDILYGNAEVNILKGGAGNDAMVGKGGGDRFEGGAGSDTVFYDASFPVSGNFAIRADLMNPGSNTGDAAGDTYSSIENLEGSSFDDILLGNDNANIMRGNHYGGARRQ